MDKQKASKEIAKRLDKMYDLFQECVEISDKSGVGFELPWGGEGTSESGLGAYYSPVGDPDAKWRRRWRDYAGWQPSAGSC